MFSRRQLLHLIPSLPFLGKYLHGNATAVAATAYRDYYKELGLRTFINAAGTYTALTGSLMPDEVADAIKYASHASL